MKLKETYTNQELVDHVYQYYIVEQNPPGSYAGVLYCCYDLSRLNDTINQKGKCSVGSILTEQELDLITADGHLTSAVGVLLECYPSIKHKLQNCTIIRQMQFAHDGSFHFAEGIEGI